MAGVLVKSVKWGVFFGKKVDLSSTQGALCTVSVFFILHFTYLGGAYAPNAPPAYGPLCCFDVRSKADISHLNLLHGTKN